LYLIAGLINSRWLIAITLQFETGLKRVVWGGEIGVGVTGEGARSGCFESLCFVVFGQYAAVWVSRDLFEVFGSDLMGPFDFYWVNAVLVYIGDVHFAKMDIVRHKSKTHGGP
jgi:hypothetical protein